MHCVRAGSAAPAARSWVGWVRVVGAADVIDALDAWQKHPFRRIPSPGQHRSGSFGSRSELFRPGLDRGPVRIRLRDAQVNRPASRAGSNLELELSLPELPPLAKQQLPTAGGPPDAEFLDAHALEPGTASQAAVAIQPRGSAPI